MYLFLRTTKITPGRMTEALGWATTITEKARQTSSLQNVALWISTLSPDIGTLVWSADVEHLADLEASDDKLMADPGYLELLDSAAKYVVQGSGHDRLTQVLVGERTESRAQYVAVVEASLALGQAERGLTLGAQIAERATRITGAPTWFCLDQTGVYGGVQWITAFDSLAAVQTANEALQADPTWLELADVQSVGAFNPAATQRVFRRIG